MQGEISIGVVMKHRGGADNGRTAPELIMGAPEEIGQALRASVLGVRS
jgi:hypothetical protein